MNHLTDLQINELLDGLDEPAVRRHIEACSDCRFRLNELQQVFASLESLPEIRLPRDLAPAVLARLSLERGSMEFRPASAWPRSLAAQWGLVVGFALWLGIRAAATLRLPVISLSSLPALWVDLFPDLSTIPPLPIPPLPAFDFQTPSLSFSLSAPHFTLLLALAALLWVMGNAVLLRSRPEVQK